MNAAYINEPALNQVRANTPFVGALSYVPNPVEVAANNQNRTDNSGAIEADVQETAKVRDRKVIWIAVGASAGILLLFVLAVKYKWINL